MTDLVVCFFCTKRSAFAAANSARSRYFRLTFLFLSSIVSLLCCADLRPIAAAERKPFAVADDIRIVHLDAGTAGAATFSPDGRYFVVLSERGRIDLNRSESSLRIYRTTDIQRLLSRANVAGEPAPFWVLTESTYKDGPLITNLRWLPNSKEIAFLLRTASGNDRLYVADTQTRTVRPLTSKDEDVTAFDIRGPNRFVYSVLSPIIRERDAEERRSAAIVGTGRDLESLMFPETSRSTNIWLHDLSDLWAVLDGKRFRITYPSSSRMVPIHLEGQRALALSPDGHFVVTALTVGYIPSEWETLYPSPVPLSPYRIRTGHQDPYALTGQRDVSEYVLIDLTTGKIKPLTDAPMGNGAGWWGFSSAEWSSDGESVVLSNTFLASAQTPPKGKNRPCVAVVDVPRGRVTCVESFQETWQLVDGAAFVHGNKQTVEIRYSRLDGTAGATTVVQLADGTWHADAVPPELTLDEQPIDVSVREDLNHPPLLDAVENGTGRSRVIWDPNPQLKNVTMSDVSVFRWRDRTGRRWVGGLYEPQGYVPGERYPLVIQTHGFDEHDFRPSGAFTTAFAAQELAAVGFVVLQVADCPIRATPDEGPCQVAGYEAAVAQLSADGLVDKNRIGIIGFSRTCYYVLEALTTSKLHFEAASITDGVDEGYLQYLLDIDVDSDDSVARDADAMIGASPFGAGLSQWFKRSPEFNMDKVTTPLQVVATRLGIAQMWEPYAALRYLNKPVDLLVLQTDQHVLTNPAERIISQGGTVDWFRFWLQGFEDSSPIKSEQYGRWRKMRQQKTTQ